MATKNVSTNGYEAAIGDTVDITVKVNYGEITVTFLIIDIINQRDYHFLAYAQQRLAKIQWKADKKWHLYEDMDLISFII